MKKLYLLFAFFLVSIIATAQPERVVLIEEATGTWCQYCPRGEVYARELAEQYPGQYVFVAVHFNDPMDYPEYADATGLSGLPTGNVDRAFSSSLEPYSDLNLDMNTRLSETPAANVSVDTDWNETTREIEITVTATVFEDLSGDYRLAAIVMEDGVTGPAPAYDQSNSYSGGDLGPMGGYENLPSSISASVMVYDHVARSLPGGYEGDANSLPETLTSGQSYSYSYTYTLPEDYDEAYVHVAGIMVDKNSGNIVNAIGGDYILGYENAPPFFQSKPNAAGFVNLNYKYDILVQDPDHDDLTITSLTELPPGLELVVTGNGTAVLSGVPSEIGNFDVTLNVNDGTWDREQSFEIEITETNKDWVLVGDQGFTESGLFGNDIRIKPDGTPVVMTLNDNDQMQLYEFVDGTWNTMGSSLSASAFHASFCLDNEGNPVAFDANGKVFRLVDGQWGQVGNDIPGGNFIFTSVVVDAQDRIHVVYYLPPSSTVAYYFDGTDWVSSGNVTDGVAVWNQLEVGPNGNPMLIYGTDGSSLLYSEMAEWDGTNWNVLGGGHIEPAAQTVFDHDFTFTSSGEIYAALTIGATRALNVYKIEDGTWQLIAEDVSEGATENCQIEADKDDNIYVAYRDENQGGRTSSKVMVDGNWENVGLPGFTNPAGGQVMAMDDNGIPYVAYQDETLQGVISCRRYGDISTAVEQLDPEAQSIDLYPNPSNGQFVVHFEEGQVLEVYNVQGQIVFKKGIQKNQKSMFVDISVPSGIYIVQIWNEGRKTTSRVMVK